MLFRSYLEICQDNYAIISALEALLIEYHSPEVQDYIYQYIIDNFEQIYAPDGISDIENILKMFESACSGVTTHTKLLDELKLKCLNLANNMNNANNLPRGRALNRLLGVCPVYSFHS